MLSSKGLILAIIFFTLPALMLPGCGRKKTTDNDFISKAKNNPIVTLEIENRGSIKIELYPEVAPNTVNNFISLINMGFYDGLIFHRVIQDFMIQGGCPEGTGYGNPGYSIKGEFNLNNHTNPIKHKRSVVSMARSRGYDTAGSQFFIVVKDSPHLDGDYAAFGKVIEGMDIVDDIAAVSTNESDKPYENQVIKRASVDTFDIEYDDPVIIE